MTGSGQKLYLHAKKRIPGGTQLLSKRPEMFLPDFWPSYYSKAKGVEVWDLDGNKYVDMSHNGVGACILGVADPDVDSAVKAAIEAGNMSTLNCPEEVELADLLCELHPWADMVRYTRCGGEAMAIAIRIARAYTGRDKIAFCGYHGWHDWYLAANLGTENALGEHLLPGLSPNGVPKGLTGTAIPFRYNHIEELQAIVERNKNDLAAIVMEPTRDHDPEPGFLELIRELSLDVGAILIFDEVSSGFRMTTGGVHLLFGVNPDISVFAKAISNGYPMAAIIGTAKVMNAAQDSFISSTYWTERIGPAAALATIRKHRKKQVWKHLIQKGEKVQSEWQKAAKQAGLNIEISGMKPMSHFSFICDSPLEVQTLFTQLMLERGFLAKNAFYATYAHTDDLVQNYADAMAKSFDIIAEALKQNNIRKYLRGSVAHSGFHRLT